MEITLLVLGIVNLIVIFAIGLNMVRSSKDSYRMYQSLVDLVKKYHFESDIRGLVEFMNQVKENRISYEKIRANEEKQIQKILNHLNSLEARTHIMHSIMEQNSTLSMMKSKSIEEMETSKLLEIIEECISTLRTKKP